jgi:hypothetical protein
MSMIWVDGRFAWAFVISVVFLLLAVLAWDYLWRMTRVGGRKLATLAGLSAILGIAAIMWLWP